MIVFIFDDLIGNLRENPLGGNLIISLIGGNEMQLRFTLGVAPLWLGV